MNNVLYWALEGTHESLRQWSLDHKGVSGAADTTEAPAHFRGTAKSFYVYMLQTKLEAIVSPVRNGYYKDCIQVIKCIP